MTEFITENTEFKYEWLFIERRGIKSVKQGRKDQKELKLYNLSEGYYGFKVIVSPQGNGLVPSKGVAHGSILYKGPSIQVNSEEKKVNFQIKTNVQTGEKLWSTIPDTICTLPDLLKGSVLFKIPYKCIKKRTVFTVTTSEVGSKVYVLHREDSGWDESSFLDAPNGPWEDISNEIDGIVVKPNGKFHAPFLSKIWCRAIEKCIPTDLPPTTRDDTYAAIFLVEGQNSDVSPSGRITFNSPEKSDGIINHSGGAEHGVTNDSKGRGSCKITIENPTAIFKSKSSNPNDSDPLL